MQDTLEDPKQIMVKDFAVDEESFEVSVPKTTTVGGLRPSANQTSSEPPHASREASELEVRKVRL